MKYALCKLASLLFLGLWTTCGTSAPQDSALVESTESKTERASEPAPIAPAKSLQTGLLLERPLDLAWYTREKFIASVSNVGAEKIHKSWNSPVVQLPAHERADVHGLRESEIKTYMRNAKAMFDRGGAIPVSDVGLVSSQEDVIRQPMLNHICVFENRAVRVYLLVQRTESDDGWSYFSIVQDMTLETPLDYYGQITDTDVRFEGTSCYKCHSSGPLAIHPAREDLVLDAKLAAALNALIAAQPTSEFYFPPDSPRPETGKPMKLDFCTSCHEKDGDRGPLFQVHSHPIRVMVDFGYMPPDEERLTKEQLAELRDWLNDTE